MVGFGPLWIDGIAYCQSRTAQNRVGDFNSSYGIHPLPAQ